jgi:seryl-tRNA synthetase
MLDIKWIRDNPQLFDKALEKRGAKPLADTIIKLDAAKRNIITETQELQQKRNELAKKLGTIADKKSQEFSDAKLEAEEIKKKLADLNDGASPDEELEKILELLPNIVDDKVPVGKDENDNTLSKNPPRTYYN